MEELPDYKKIVFEFMPGIPLDEAVPDTAPGSIALLKRFLTYPSSQRVSAKEALADPYFFTRPLAAHPSDLPVTPRVLDIRFDLEARMGAHYKSA